MRTVALSILAILMGLSASALTAAAIYFPVLDTNLGYTYSIVAPHSFAGYAIAVTLAAFALLADKLRPDIASRLSFLPIILVGGMMVYTFNLTEEGRLWATRQAAFDAPSWSTSDLDAFWTRYETYVGESHRGYYETWGPHFHFNDVTLYYNNMWRADMQQAQELLNSAGHRLHAEPTGLFLLMSALAMQLTMSLMLVLRSILTKRQTQSS